MRILLYCIFYLLVSETSAQTISEGHALYSKMMHAIEGVKTCTFNLEVEERIFDKMVYGNHDVKLQTHPYKLYIHSNSPDEGAEILYLEGNNNGKVLINPNRFPFFNINLSPYSSLLRKNHHYVIPQVGFDYLYKVLKGYEVREKDKFYSKIKVYKPNNPNQNYIILEIDNEDFGMMNYKVMKNETITDIANKFFINDQMILELNRNIGYFDDASTGQVITLPSSYARRIVFYIDKKTNLPLTQIIYDNKGLYSKIIFTNFVLNPILKEQEFTRDYKDYKF